MPTNPTFAELLLKHGLLEPAELEEVQQQATEQDTTIEEVIRAKNLVYPEPLAQLKAESLGVPYIDLTAITIDQAAMADVSEQAAVTHHFIVFNQTADQMQVALANPEDDDAAQAVRFIADRRHKQLEIFCASRDSIDQALHANEQAAVDSALTAADESPSPTATPDTELAEAPVNKVFAVIMRHAVEGAASDIHLEPLADQLRVRYRIDGQLHTSLTLPVSVQGPLLSRIKMLAHLKVRSRAPQEGRFSFTALNQPFTVRAVVVPTIKGEKITLHLIDTSKASPSFSELGLVGHQQDIFTDHLRHSEGLVVIAGPDGAGKSTTMFAALSMLNTPNTNIATVEELIEYEIPGVSQTSVSSTGQLSYATALAMILRQDVDIVMIEEIADRPAAQRAAKGALAGHLVLTTMPTTTALSTIPQLLDLGVSPYMLSAGLHLLVAQRLVPKLCQECLTEVPISKDVRPTITDTLKKIARPYRDEAQLPRRLTFFKSQGCPSCQERGHSGQLALFEIIPIDQSLRAAITDGATLAALRQAATTTPYLSLRQAGLIKALQGQARYEDIIRVTPA